MLCYDIYTDEKYKEVEYADGNMWKSIKCPKYDGHQRNGDRIGNLRIKLTTKKYGDFLWTFLSDCIITDKVANIFNKNKITGYELKPIEIYNKKLIHNADKLWEFLATGNGGEAHSDSGIYLKEKCDYCGLKIYSAYEHGIIVDESNWDRSDIFTVIGYSKHILITERVKELIVKHKLTGALLTPSHELKWPELVIKP